MSSNPPDPNEYLKFLIQQQQQAQRQQAQGGATARHQPNQQGTVPSADSGVLGNLVAGYLRASSTTSASGNGTAATGSSPFFALLLPSTNAPAANNPDSVQQQQQQLLASAKLLSSVNPSLAAAVVEHAMALVQPAPQRQQGIPPHLHQHGTPHQFSLNPQGQHPLSSLSTDATKKSPSSSINSSGNGTGTSNPSQPSVAFQGTSGSSRDSTNSNSNGNKKKGSVTICLPPEPACLLTLQTWNMDQLEAHANLLKECNQPIPNAVKILLDDARHREEKHHAKRIANRKLASTSRSRKKQVCQSSDSKNEGKKCSKHKTSPAKSNSRSTVSLLTQKSSSLASTEDNEEPPTKKSKTTVTENKTNATAVERKTKSPDSGSSEEPKASGVVDMNVDDVMGASVTKNNAGAKLSSLMHYSKEELKEEADGRKPPPEELQQQPHIHRKHGFAPRNAPQKQDSQSSSSTESAPEARAGINSSEDSGYRDSNESSDEYAEDSSSISGASVTSRKKGKRPRPLAPGCNVRLIRNNLSTIWCELTSSIRTRRFNDEDSELGIIDHNPKPAAEEPTAEKELLLCFRPILEGRKVGEEFRFPRQVSESSNANESEELTFNKSSSGNDEKGVDFGADAPSSETQADRATGPKVEGQHPLKKRPFEDDDTNSNASSKKVRNEGLKLKPTE